MATLYEMQTRVKQFYNLRENLDQVIRYINNSIDCLEPSAKNFLTSYNVDGSSKGYSIVKKNISTLVERRDTIKNTIIPAINYEIRILKKSIEEEQLKLT